MVWPWLQPWPPLWVLRRTGFAAHLIPGTFAHVMERVLRPARPLCAAQ